METNDYPGLLVTVEGVDGAGKTTLINAAEENLHNVLVTREPAEQHWTGKQVRRAINDDDSHPVTDFHFFLGDRANHLKNTVVPALERGQTVISDRYSDSTRAYQQEVLAGAVEDPEAFIDYNLDQPWHLTPDLTILLDIPAAESARRTSEGDKYEKSAFIEQVRENYLDLADAHDRIIYLDGTKPKDFIKDFGLTLIQEAQAQKAEEQMA